MGGVTQTPILDADQPAFGSSKAGRRAEGDRRWNRAFVILIHRRIHEGSGS